MTGIIRPAIKQNKTMKTYWDYTDKERSELTEQQVTSLLDVEMMEKGVLKPIPPTLAPIVTPDGIGKRSQFFGVRGKGKYGSDESLGICFETCEQAVAFMQLNPLKEDYEYDVGSEFRYAKPISEMAIETSELFAYETIMAAQSGLKKNKAARDENSRLQSDYQKACAEAGKVTDNVWKDWHRVRANDSEMKRVVSTFKEYHALTGDKNLALTFLGKIFSQSEIDEAREWFPGEMPEVMQDVQADPLAQ